MTGFPRVGSALIVRDEANRILLGKRNKDPQRGCWVIPGGKIHAFETIADAAARELEEETGLTVRVQQQFRVYEVINPPEEHRIVIYSWAKVESGTPVASDDLSEVRFFPLKELGSVAVTPLVKRVLQDAGLIANLVTLPAPQQLPLFSNAIPLLLAGATLSQRRSRSARIRIPRPSRVSICTARLQFER
jgi:8-oxo-dGTP diphosphatase